MPASTGTAPTWPTLGEGPASDTDLPRFGPTALAQGRPGHAGRRAPAARLAVPGGVAADYIASQLPLPAARWLYSPSARSTIVPAPAALNLSVYRPTGGARPIDLGFRGDLYSFAIGDQERTEALRYFEERATALGL